MFLPSWRAYTWNMSYSNLSHQPLYFGSWDFWETNPPFLTPGRKCFISITLKITWDHMDSWAHWKIVWKGASSNSGILANLKNFWYEIFSKISQPRDMLEDGHYCCLWRLLPVQRFDPFPWFLSIRTLRTCLNILWDCFYHVPTFGVAHSQRIYFNLL